MSVEAVIHRLVCDECHAAWIQPVAHTPRAAREIAALAGWTMVGYPDDYRDRETADRCPRCTRRLLTRDPALVGGAGS